MKNNTVPSTYVAVSYGDIDRAIKQHLAAIDEADPVIPSDERAGLDDLIMELESIIRIEEISFSLDRAAFHRQGISAKVSSLYCVVLGRIYKLEDEHNIKVE